MAGAGRLLGFARRDAFGFDAAFGFGLVEAFGFAAFGLAGAFEPAGVETGLRVGDGLAAARAEARRLPAAVDAR